MAKVHIIDDGVAARLLFNEMVRVSNCGKNIQEMFLIQDIPVEERTGSRDGPAVEVVLTVNGVSVDPIEVLTQSWGRAVKQFNEEVAKEARKMVSVTSLDRINEVLQKAEYEIVDELRKNFPHMDFSREY